MAQMLEASFNLYFRTDPEKPIEFMLKTGIHRVYESFIQQKKPKCQVRFAVVRALDLLIAVDTEPRTPIRQKTRKPLADPKFFSSRENRLIVFFRNELADKEIEVESFDPDKIPEMQTKTSSKQLINQRFKKDAAQFLASYTENDVETVIFNGVLKVMNAAEDFVGPAIETFVMQKTLFRKLKQLYEVESIEALTTQRGLYSSWIAVDEALAEHEARRQDIIDRTKGRIGV